MRYGAKRKDKMVLHAKVRLNKNPLTIGEQYRSYTLRE